MKIIYLTPTCHLLSLSILGIVTGLHASPITGPSAPEPIEQTKVLDAETLKQDSPDASIKNGLYSRSLKFGGKAGEEMEKLARKKVLTETIETQDAAEGRKVRQDAANDELPMLNVEVEGKTVYRMFANAISANLIGGNAENEIAGSAVGGTISGGGDRAFPNRIYGDYGTVGGGLNNQAGALYTYLDTPYTTISGGRNNRAARRNATVGGGESNHAKGLSSGIAAGSNNTAEGPMTFVGGGYQNGAFADYATVNGGYTNAANAKSSAIAGGEFNRVDGLAGSIGGGLHNTASGEYSTVPGGHLNHAKGKSSLAAGSQAKAIHNGTFVWADRQDVSFASTTTNQFLIRAQGNVGIDTVTPSEKLTVRGNIAPDQAGTYHLGTPARPWQNLHLAGAIDYPQQLAFSHQGKPVMVLDDAADMIVAGTVFAERFADQSGNIIGGLNEAEVVQIMNKQVSKLVQELRQRDALLRQMGERLARLEARMDAR
jgi:hypothetical protein